MTTENNFTATAETLKENVSKGMKWMQDANAKFVETQKQQMKTATDMFNNSNPQFGNSNTLNNSFGASSKAMTELFQKNMETATNFMKTVMKPITELTKFSDKESLTNEMKKQFETVNQQAADLMILNQTNLDLIFKQLETTSKSFTPLTEQFKKEVEKAVESSKATMQTIIDSYTNFAAPSIEANKEAMDKVNEQIKTNINANIKFWSDLMNSATSTVTSAANNAADAKDGLLKISANPTAKKQATANMN